MRGTDDRYVHSTAMARAPNARALDFVYQLLEHRDSKRMLAYVRSRNGQDRTPTQVSIRRQLH
jgi:hypothetical protein